MLSEETAVNFGIQISEIIAYLHRQKPTPILYLDLKPQNIIINNGRVYLVDFGNSMFINSKRKYMSGTKGYAAPEQYTFDGIDFSTDVYGIGALLYFMVTGLVVENGKEINFDADVLVSEGFRKIIIQCMLPKEKRFLDALMVAGHLSEIIHAKLHKMEINKTGNGLVEEPLVISVFGAGRHIGVTHFSLALAGRLNERGISTVYEDRAGNVIRAFYKRCDNCRLAAGIYYYENIMMKYSYSDMVLVNENIRCKIIDCSGENVNKEMLETSNLVVLIAGKKPWEMDVSAKVIEALNEIGVSGKKAVFWNFAMSPNLDCVPVFCNPFVRTSDVNVFFDKVISLIIEEGNTYKNEKSKRIFRFFTGKKRYKNNWNSRKL